MKSEDIRQEIESISSQVYELEQKLVEKKKEYALAVQEVVRVRAKDVKNGDKILRRTEHGEHITSTVGEIYVKKNGMILFLRNGFAGQPPSVGDTWNHIGYANEPEKWIEIVKEPEYDEDKFYHEVATATNYEM